MDDPPAMIDDDSRVDRFPTGIRVHAISGSQGL
jgi:hypothetical protein